MHVRHVVCCKVIEQEEPSPKNDDLLGGDSKDIQTNYVVTGTVKVTQQKPTSNKMLKQE